MRPAQREEFRAGASDSSSQPSSQPPPPPLDEAARRARVRRFGLALALGVALLALLVVGYVLLFERVLIDRSRPPTAATVNPRVMVVELLVALGAAVAITIAVVRQRAATQRRNLK
ncbi:MAG: hypothetical protein EXS13_11170 [Planctomycetes bacterium]|nr:hypothetical protein [Planctomycetota bacterium]